MEKQKYWGERYPVLWFAMFVPMVALLNTAWLILEVPRLLWENASRCIKELLYGYKREVVETMVQGFKEAVVYFRRKYK